MKLLFLTAIIFFFNVCFSQNIDSLQKIIINKSYPDTLIIEAYNELSFQYRNLGSIDTAVLYANRGLELSIKNKRIKNEALLLNTLGVAYAYRAQNDSSKYCFEKAIVICVKINNQKQLSKSYSNLGRLYFNLSNYKLALKNYLISMKINESLKNHLGLATNYNNIGGIYFDQKDFNKSLFYYLKSDSILKLHEGNSDLAFLQNNIANSYIELKNYKKGLDYYYNSLKLQQKDNNLIGAAAAKENIGVALTNCIINNYLTNGYEKLNRANFLDTAESYLLWANQVYLKSNYVYNYSSNYLGLARIYGAKNEIQKAIKYSKIAITFADSVQSIEKLIAAYTELFNFHIINKDYNAILTTNAILNQLKDSLYSQKNKENLFTQTLSYDFEKKALTDSIKNDIVLKTNLLILKEEKKKTNALILIVLIVFIFSGFLYNRYKVTQKQKATIEAQKLLVDEQRFIAVNQKHIIEEKHKEIHDSINYAKRIQYSLLASNKLLNENLKDYFLFFKPKDVVSGDFYWGASVNSMQLSVSSSATANYTLPTNHLFFLATADSTGHGVPGAIMSMLNISCLNEALNSDKLLEPADILNATRKKVISHLANDGSEEGGKDGMDCSLCAFDFENKILKVAAAHNPVWIVRSNSPFEGGAQRAGDVVTSLNNYRDNAPEIIEIKPDKMPVGKHDRQDILFTQHEIQLQTGDVIYTLTDGFPDQFGGEKGKKFMSKNLREFLAANAHLSMSDQKELLEKTFTDWKQDLEQVDDVTVIGIRIS